MARRGTRLWGTGGPDGVRPRSRAAGCLIWVLALLVILLLLSLLFGGFQKGTKDGLRSVRDQRLHTVTLQLPLGVSWR
jgi:hypothetical protein